MQHFNQMFSIRKIKADAILLMVFIALFLISCNRTTTPTPATQGTDLSGTWKLVETISEVNGTVNLPPANASRYITITFKDNGSFTGNTIVNEIGGTCKFENGKDLDIMLGFLTKINEDDWGRNFCDVLMSCHLQSLSPCIKPSYEIKNGNLIIHSVANYDLILTR